MKTLKFLYSNEGTTRLDTYLSEACEDLSRSRVQDLIKKSMVTINGQIITKPSSKLNINDEIIVTVPDPEISTIKPKKLKLEILYEDNDIIVVNKKSGLVVHAGAGTQNEDTLVEGVLHHAKNLSGIGGELRPGVVHRLDKDTSGVILMCKNDRAHQYYSELFMKRKMNKQYVAICFSKPAENEGTYISHIGRHPQYRVKMASNGQGGREAITNYKVQEEFKYFSVINASPKTGRTHQIRVHLSENGTPLLGDETYKIKNIENNIWTQISEANNKLLKLKKMVKRLMLHAHKLSFIDRNNNELSIEAPIPMEMKKLIEFLRKNS